jgi:hypothetical protein
MKIICFKSILKFMNCERKNIITSWSFEKRHFSWRFLGFSMGLGVLGVIYELFGRPWEENQFLNQLSNRSSFTVTINLIFMLFL